MSYRDDVIEINDNAACMPSDWDLFVSEDTVEQARARAICADCPVRQLCLETHFLEQHIVVGGTTWKERLKSLHRDEGVPESVDGRLRAMSQTPAFMYHATLMGLCNELMVKLIGRYAK